MNARVFALIRSFFFASLFIWLWTWLIPRSLARGPLVPRWSAPAIVVMAIGGAIMLRCVFDFGWSGEGTPLPLDPPRRFVVRALYRYVRNPMYVGMAIFLAGESILLPEIRRGMWITIALGLAAAHTLIIVHEEPSLRERFGEDYLDYCRHVRRWIPRLRPFDVMR
jgi:protein-S-isoprenylcysteine O-methyltransferase Ste14